jgi:hypothetical protein
MYTEEDAARDLDMPVEDVRDAWDKAREDLSNWTRESQADNASREEDPD